MIGLAESVVGVAGKVLDKFVEDKDLKTKLAAELQSEMLSIDRLNAQANVEASKHPSMFVSGARPALLWLSVIGIGWQTIFLPVASWAVAIWAPEVELPAINTEGLMTLTLSLLGLGSMRTVEKLKGTARENMRATK